MGLLRLAQSPLVAVEPQTSVFEAVDLMHKEGIGAVAVMEGDALRGIFSERDVMLRVVLQNRNPEKTKMSDVMTAAVETIRRDSSADDALKLMLEKHIRHLPVVERDGKIVGMISIRNLLQEKVEELTDQLDSLEAYFSADGAGG
ncbi:MAG: CBS domain-containing protein [Acidobacteria bacterium]|nr:CBS domain-containing protein [Acidobacteriota bacterium]